MQLPDETSRHFEYVNSLDAARLTELLVDAKLEGLVEPILEGRAQLSGQAAKSGAELNDKFASSAKFQMSYGSLSLFYGGLESLLGGTPPTPTPPTPTRVPTRHPPTWHLHAS